MRALVTPSLWPKFIDGCCNPYVFKPNHCKRRRAQLASIYTPAKLKDGRRDPCLILLTFRQVKQCCVISFTSKSIFLFLLVAILKFITLWPHQSMRKLYKKNSWITVSYYYSLTINKKRYDNLWEQNTTLKILKIFYYHCREVYQYIWIINFTRFKKY